MEKITTHIEDAKNRLIERYKNRPKIEGVISLFAGKMQELEDAIDYYQNHRWIDNAEGFQLDLLGELIGQNREGFDDATYRIFLYIKIQINSSHGNGDSIMKIFRAITGATNTFYNNLGGGHVEIQGNGSNPFSSTQKLIDQISRILIAGVELSSIGITTDTPFEFFGGSGLGFYDPGETIQGTFGLNLGA